MTTTQSYSAHDVISGQMHLQSLIRGRIVTKPQIKSMLPHEIKRKFLPVLNHIQIIEATREL